MSRQPSKGTAPATAEAKPPAKVPGDHLSAAEHRQAQESTLSQIKRELDAERIRNEAIEKAKAAELAGSHVQLAQMEETVEGRAASFEATIDLVRREMEEQAQQNPPRTAPPPGLDDESISLIKAELTKSHKRVVLPHG